MLTMATLSFKRIFQLAVPAGFLTGAVLVGLYGAPSIALVERLGSRTPFPCPFHLLTGWDCPGCGLTRSMTAFFMGDVSLSFYFNPLGPILGFALGAAWVLSFRGFQWRLAVHVLQRHSLSLLLIALAWGVLRNF